MTKPPLLPLLGLAAILGAVWFLVFSVASPAAVKQGAIFGQGRAFAAIAQERGEATEAANETEEDGELEVSPVRVPENITMAEAGRIRAAQREFLIDADHWRGAKAKEIRAVTRPYCEARGMWSLRMLGFANYKGINPGPGLQNYRVQMDGICADVQQLTSAAKREWNDWQAKNWEGWQSVEWSSYSPGIAATSAVPREEESLEASIMEARPLLNEYEYIEDMRARADAEVAGLEEQGYGGGGGGVGNEWRNTPYLMQGVWLAQFQRVSTEVEELARELGQRRGSKEAK